MCVYIKYFEQVAKAQIFSNNRYLGLVNDSAVGSKKVTRGQLWGVLYRTSFPCRYRQTAGFAGPWKTATLTRRYAHTPANEKADLVSLNIAAPV